MDNSTLGSIAKHCPKHDYHPILHPVPEVIHKYHCDVIETVINQTRLPSSIAPGQGLDIHINTLDAFGGGQGYHRNPG